MYGYELFEDYNDYSGDLIFKEISNAGFSVSKKKKKL